MFKAKIGGPVYMGDLVKLVRDGVVVHCENMQDRCDGSVIDIGGGLSFYLGDEYVDVIVSSLDDVYEIEGETMRTERTNGDNKDI